MKKRLMAIAATLALASSLLLIPVPSTIADEPVNPVSPSYNEGTLVFEAETYSAKADSVYPANDQEKESLAGYSGGGFMRVIEGDITYNIKVPMAGAYAVHIFGANVDASGRKHDSVHINGTEYYAAMPGQGYAWQDVQIAAFDRWDNGNAVFSPVASVNLTAGVNTIRIAKNNGGYLYYDKIVLTPAWTLSGGEQLVLDIEALPSAVQLTDKAAFEAVKARYEALDADEQAKVTNYSKVTLALDQIAELERAGIQDPTTDGDKLIYETELSVTNGDASISSDNEHFQNFSGTGYVQIGENGGFTMRINVPTAGQYLVYVTGAGTDAGDKCEYFKINDSAPWLIALPGGTAYQWADCQPGTENYTDGALTPAVPAGGFAFSQGENTLTFTANWGKSAYDKVVLVPYTEPSPGEALAADIGRLPAVVQLADKDKIQALKDRYDDLDDEEKAKVTNYNKLLEALNQIQELDKFNQPQQPVKVDNKLVYEAEHAVVAGGTSISSDGTNFQNFSGSGYVYLGDGGFTMKIHVPAANQYRVYVVAANDNNGARCDYLQINGAAEKWLVSAPAAPAYGWAMCQPGTENWVNNVLIPAAPEEGFAFREGENTLVFSANCEQDDPQKIHRLMSVLHLNRRLVTEEVALEAVRQDAGVLYDIPQTAITPLVADTAVRGDPRMIQWIPRELRTSDLCLYAEAAHPELRVYVPDEIAKGRNIYSFHRQVDAKLRQPLEYEQYIPDFIMMKRQSYLTKLNTRCQITIYTIVGFLTSCRPGKKGKIMNIISITVLDF